MTISLPVRQESLQKLRGKKPPTHRDGGELESILQNDLSKLAVVQYQVGGIPVQPVYEAASCRHDVGGYVHLRQFHSTGGGGIGTGPSRGRRSLVGGVKGRDELGGLLGESADKAHGGVLGAAQVLQRKYCMVAILFMKHKNLQVVYNRGNSNNNGHNGRC